MSTTCPKCHTDNPTESKFCMECATPFKHDVDITEPFTKTLDTPAEELTTGSTFAGRYQIIEELGKGGMGKVYKVFDTKIKEKIALKLIKSEIASNKLTIERFTDELKLARKITHKNIGRMFDINEDENLHYITMEYVEGQDLRGLIRQTGQLAVGTALSIAKQVCNGLTEAHQMRVVHRDLKPANIMIDRVGNARIMDFGIAKSIRAQGVTGEGIQIGTPAYMSPEQAQGQGVDHRTDIWSLGVVLYEMLTGQLPFKGEHDQSIIHSILKRNPEPLSALRTGISADLEGIINKVLAKSPDKRYNNAAEMLADIESIEKELETKEVTSKPSPVKNLFKRRVPQIWGIYTVAALLIWQIVKWLVNRFALSPFLPDFCLVALLSLLPAVLILAYSHGEHGRGRWTKAAKIVIPANLFLSAVLLLFLFYGKDLGAATKTVSYTDEEGQEVERVIPKSEFRKKIALFYFDNETEDSGLDWLQYGIVKALEMDLAQDLYLSINSHFPRALIRAGFQEGTGVPLALKKIVSQRQHFDYFLSGRFVQNEGELTINTSLFEAKRLKLLEERTFIGEDIFALIDEISVRIKRDLKIPDYHIEETEDKPVSEVFTHSLIALELSAKAYFADQFKSELEKTKNYLERAVEEDPSFAFGWSKLADVYFGLNQGEKADEALREAMAHDYKLSEKENFNLKYTYFFIKEDQEMVFNLAKRRVELYPDDIEGHEWLAEAYWNQNQGEKAISEYKIILELDPERFETLRDIASVYQDMGESEKALDNLKLYADKYPDDPKSFMAIGKIYESQGRYDLAKDYYREALLIDPEDVYILIGLAAFEAKQGNFAQAEKQYNDALRASKIPQDLVSIYNELGNYYEMRGQFNKAIDYMDQAQNELKKYEVPLGISMTQINYVMIYASAGRYDLALQTIEKMGEIMAPFDKLASLGHIQLYLETEDTGKLEKAIEDVETLIKSWGVESFRTFVLFAQGKIHEIKGEYEDAIYDYQSSLDLGQLDTRVEEGIGRCFRMMKEFDKAENTLQKVLLVEPFNPQLNYEIALVYWDMGKKEKALDHLNKTLYVWEDADLDYKPAIEARKNLAEWESY